jgi:hypothetical protein
MLIQADGRFTTLTCRWGFSGRLAGVPCKPPFAEFVENLCLRALIAQGCSSKFHRVIMQP